MSDFEPREHHTNSFGTYNGKMQLLIERFSAGKRVGYYELSIPAFVPHHQAFHVNAGVIRVEPEDTRQGHGQALMETTETFLRKLASYTGKPVYWEPIVSKKNEAAIAFFSKRGFRQRPMRDSFEFSKQIEPSDRTNTVEEEERELLQTVLAHSGYRHQTD